MTVRPLVLVVLLAASTAVGCGGDGGRPGSDTAVTPGAPDGINDLKALLEGAKAAGKKPPARREELMQLEVEYPVATGAVARDQVRYVYGKGLTGGSEVVAYETTAEQSGGWVLLADGTVKQMTADEFKAVKPAGGKR